MKTKLEFEFGEDDDSGYPKVYTSAPDMYFALGEIKERLRSIVKFDEGNYTKLSGHEAIEKFREEFSTMMFEHGIDLNALS